jgi:hypothetical protein
MIRFVLLCFGAASLFVSSAQAHGVHADCRVGDSRMGVVPHFHPGGYGQAVACGGGGGGGGGYGRGYREPGYGGGGGGGYYRAPSGRNVESPMGPVIGRGEAVGCPPGIARYKYAGCVY